jgi:hypothetical protein
MPFEDKENLSDLKTFTDEVWFSNDVRFYGTLKSLGNAEVVGSLDLQSSASVKEIFEKNVVSEASINGEIIINVLDGSLHNFTTNASGNFTFNIRANESTSLNSLMLDRRSIVITALIPMGSSAYVLSNPSTSGFKIDGTVVTVNWIGSSPPSSGFSNSINSYTFAIIKNSAANYTVLGTLTRFG